MSQSKPTAPPCTLSTVPNERQPALSFFFFSVVPSICVWSSSSFVMGGRPCQCVLYIHNNVSSLQHESHSTGKGWRMLLSAARGDFSPRSSPPTPGTDKNDGGFCLGHPEPHFGEEQGKDNRHSFKSVSGVVSPPDRKRFDQRISSSIFSATGVPPELKLNLWEL